MKRIEYRTVDKSTWDEGPWLGEPDKVQWMDEATGLACIIRRNNDMGFWCGYVGVPRSHRAYMMDYDKADGEFGLDVHGGLTFSDKCMAGDEATSICHLVEPGEDDDVWWLGFDCGHYMDHKPGHIPTMSRVYRDMGKEYTPWSDPQETYRDQVYVTEETLNLARQLAQIVPIRMGLDDEKSHQ